MIFFRKINKTAGIPLFIFFLSVFLFLTTSCAGVKTEKVEKKVRKKEVVKVLHDKVIIRPNRSYEECVELLPSHVMEYSFKASKPVDFNIHYHGEEKVFYPVSKVDVNQWRGTIDVSSQSYYKKELEDFCLMWQNPHSDRVIVTFDYEIRDK